MPSLQDIIRARQRDDFVGRSYQRDAFRQNIDLPFTDEQRKFVYSLHGQAGIGKTYLLRQLHTIAVECGALAAVTDENETDLVATMAAISRQLDEQGARIRNFRERYEEYMRHRDELLSDPQVPPSTEEAFSTAAVRVGVGAVKTVAPGIGFLADALTPEQLSAQLEQARALVKRKFTKHAIARLLLSPIDELTPLLVRDMRQLSDHRQVALLFDGFEHTGQIIEPWLLRLLEGQYGALPASLLIVIAGQNPLDVNKWGAYSAIREEWRLDPFTEHEARTLLTRKGIDDPEVIEVVLRLSGRIPLLVATLADNQPTRPEDISDPSGDAVERFLRSESDTERRDDALLAALPRILNEDVLEVLTGEQQARELLHWLREHAFVEESQGRLRYDPVVRAPMVRHARGRSPRRFVDRHHALADHYRDRRERLKVATHAAWSDVDWQHLMMEETYHRLCSDPRAGLAEALYGAAQTFLCGRACAVRWTDMLADAGRDAGAPVLTEWATELRTLLDDNATGASDFLSYLIDRADLPQSRMDTLLRIRAGLVHGRHGVARASWRQADDLGQRPGLFGDDVAENDFLWLVDGDDDRGPAPPVIGE